MKLIKIFPILFMFMLIQNLSFAIDMGDVTSPKEASYRFGTTDVPEQKYNFEVKAEEKNAQIIPKIDKEYKNNNNLTYADLSIKSMSSEISKSLDMDYNDMMGDLSLLWQGAATRSDTIKFAIYKLSNPDKDKPDTNAVKKVLTTIAGMSTMVGAGMGNPVLASAALISGNTLGIMSNDTKALNYKYTQVTDADMILLARDISKQIEDEMEYPGQIKVNVVRESRVIDYAK